VSSPRHPLPALSVVEASAIVIGIVVGIGIFKTPPIVAANVDSQFEFIGLWLIGGLLTVVGALCYAELGSARPHAGGEYHYLKEAYGEGLGFLFAWSRMTVMQTGAIAAVAFAYGDYAASLIPLGPSGPAVHAALAVIVLAGLQLAGTHVSTRVQVTLTLLTVVLVVVVAAAGFMGAEEAPPPTVPTPSQGAAGLALVFILLSYGGWNEAAYLSGELRDAPRNVLRVLLAGTGVVTALYLLINMALVSSIGLDGLRKEKLVTEPVEAVFGPLGAVATAVVICIAALSTLNGTMFTGARSIHALGQNFPLLGPIGEINETSGAPTNAIIVQAAIALGLIGFGATTRDGFTAMVEYTAPTFWMFMALVGFSLFLFRWREPSRPIPFRVPLYPFVPIVFCATAVYLVHSSVAYTGLGAVVGLAIVVSGVPLYWLGRRMGVRSRYS
jgi:APA family basic amino acid/polyamine antiporter